MVYGPQFIDPALVPLCIDCSKEFDELMRNVINE